MDDLCVAQERLDIGADGKGGDGGFSPTELVRVHGLKAREDLNGTHVFLLSWVESASRWAVCTADGERVKIRSANLEHAPCSPTTLSKFAVQDTAPPAVGTLMSLHWDFNPAPERLSEGIALCADALKAMSASPGRSWFVFVRRSKHWLGFEPSRRRLWYVAIVRPPNLADVFILEGPLASQVAGSHAHISPAYVAACVATLVRKVQQAPAGLLCAPVGLPSSTPRSAERLAEMLRSALGPVGLQCAAAKCAQLPADQEWSVTRLSIAGSEEQQAWIRYSELVDARFVQMEEKMNRDLALQTRGLSDKLVGLCSTVANKAVSLRVLTELFAASALFHDRRPWTTMSNDEWLHVRSPSGDEAWLMACGHTDYDGRGLNIFWCFDDLEVCRADPWHQCKGWVDRLQYVMPEMSSFDTLDLIAEFDLPLASEANGENIPQWYRARKQPEVDFESVISCFNKPVPAERWPFLVTAMRACVRFAAEPALISRVGTLRIMRDSPIVLEGLVVQAGAFSDDRGKMR